MMVASTSRMASVTFLCPLRRRTCVHDTPRPQPRSPQLAADSLAWDVSETAGRALSLRRALDALRTRRVARKAAPASLARRDAALFASAADKWRTRNGELCRG